MKQIDEALLKSLEEYINQHYVLGQGTLEVWFKLQTDWDLEGIETGELLNHYIEFYNKKIQ